MTPFLQTGIDVICSSSMTLAYCILRQTAACIISVFSLLQQIQHPTASLIARVATAQV